MENFGEEQLESTVDLIVKEGHSDPDKIVSFLEDKSQEDKNVYIQTILDIIIKNTEKYSDLNPDIVKNIQGYLKDNNATVSQEESEAIQENTQTNISNILNDFPDPQEKLPPIDIYQSPGIKTIQKYIKNSDSLADFLKKISPLILDATQTSSIEQNLLFLGCKNLFEHTDSLFTYFKISPQAKNIDQFLSLLTNEPPTSIAAQQAGCKIILHLLSFIFQSEEESPIGLEANLLKYRKQYIESIIEQHTNRTKEADLPESENISHNLKLYQLQIEQDILSKKHTSNEYIETVITSINDTTPFKEIVEPLIETLFAINNLQDITSENIDTLIQNEKVKIIKILCQSNIAKNITPQSFKKLTQCNVPALSILAATSLSDIIDMSDNVTHLGKNIYARVLKLLSPENSFHELLQTFVLIDNIPNPKKNPQQKQIYQKTWEAISSHVIEEKDQKEYCQKIIDFINTSKNQDVHSEFFKDFLKKAPQNILLEFLHQGTEEILIAQMILESSLNKKEREDNLFQLLKNIHHSSKKLFINLFTQFTQACNDNIIKISQLISSFSRKHPFIDIVFPKMQEIIIEASKFKHNHKNLQEFDHKMTQIKKIGNKIVLEYKEAGHTITNITDMYNIEKYEKSFSADCSKKHHYQEIRKLLGLFNEKHQEIQEDTKNSEEVDTTTLSRSICILKKIYQQEKNINQDILNKKLFQILVSQKNISTHEISALFFQFPLQTIKEVCSKTKQNIKDTLSFHSLRESLSSPLHT